MDNEYRLELLRMQDVCPDPEQPREYFDEAKLEALRASIETIGLKNPIHVKPAPDFESTGRYLIVGGERRWRSFNALGREYIPALIIPADTDTDAWALVDNTVREKLNPIEEARTFRRLIQHKGLTQARLAKSIGASQPFVSNRLALLKLPVQLIEHVARGTLKTSVCEVLLRRCASHEDMLHVMSELGRKYHGVTRVKLAALECYLDVRDRMRLIAQRDEAAIESEDGQRCDEDHAKVLSPVAQASGGTSVSGVESLSGNPRLARRKSMRELIATATHLSIQLDTLVAAGDSALSKDEFAAMWGSLERREKRRLVELFRLVNDRSRMFVERVRSTSSERTED